VPWCHTCRIEYEHALERCRECGGDLSDAPAPERRLVAGPDLVVVATLPPEQALLAAGRLDAGGIPSSLRDVGSDGAMLDPDAVHVLVPHTHRARARALLRSRRRRGRERPLLLYLWVVTLVALAMSAAIVGVRWLLTGSPLPR
jgi:hypothetical protein